MKDTINYGALKAEPGEKVQGWIPLGNTNYQMPMTLINGVGEGKTILISSGIHGSEYLGIQTAIELAAELTPQQVCGQLIILHPVNTEAFFQRVAYIHPGLGINLNRNYPGKPEGTVGEQIAYFFTEEFHKRVDFTLDLHGGDLPENLLPYVYYPGIGEEGVIKKSYEAAMLLHSHYIVKSGSTTGFYNSCAIVGTPALLIERGGQGIWSKEEVTKYKSDIRNLLVFLRILEGQVQRPNRAAIEITQAEYLDANVAGCWYPAVGLEAQVKKGQLLGIIKDFFGNILEEIYANYDGFIIFLTTSLGVSKGDPIITYGR